MKKPCVVLIEDDMLLAQQYQRVLASAGFETHHVSDTITAIDTIDDTQPQALVVDMLLPGTTALTLLHELQSHADLAEIPVILVSNIVSELDMGDMSAYGVKRMLDKTTMHPQDIVSAVRGVLA